MSRRPRGGGGGRSVRFSRRKGDSYDKGKFIAIWKQENGRWKLYREIWNSDVAAEIK